MPLGTFTLFTVIGSLVWNTVLIVAGYSLAEQWDKILKVTEPFQKVVVAAIAVLIVAFIARRIIRTRREIASGEAESPGITSKPLEEVVESLEELAERDPQLRSKLHDD